MTDTAPFLELELAIDRQDYDCGLKLATQLSDEYHTNVYVQYTLALCLIHLGKANDAKAHLEMAAFLLSSSNKSKPIEVDSWLAVLRLLARTGLATTASKLMKDHYKNIHWNPESLEELKEVTKICLVLEEPSLGLQILDHAFHIYNETPLASEYLIVLATAAHAADEAELEIQTYIKALEIDPLNPKVHSKLSRFLGREKNWDMASDHIKFIRALDPEFETRSIAQDFYNLSKVGSFDEQERLKEKWLADDIIEQESRAPFAALLASDNGKFLLREAEQFAEWTLLLPNKDTQTLQNKVFTSRNSKKMRIGYVSPDFRDHAVCHLITDLIRSHSRDQFEVFGYGISMRDKSLFRDRVVAAFDTFKKQE
jgi:tetratricopeptide (TPR) repeat protein